LPFSLSLISFRSSSESSTDDIVDDTIHAFYRSFYDKDETSSCSSEDSEDDKVKVTSLGSSKGKREDIFIQVTSSSAKKKRKYHSSSSKDKEKEEVFARSKSIGGGYLPNPIDRDDISDSPKKVPLSQKSSKTLLPTSPSPSSLTHKRIPSQMSFKGLVSKSNPSSPPTSPLASPLRLPPAQGEEGKRTPYEDRGSRSEGGAGTEDNSAATSTRSDSELGMDPWKETDVEPDLPLLDVVDATSAASEEIDTDSRDLVPRGKEPERRERIGSDLPALRRKAQLELLEAMTKSGIISELQLQMGTLLANKGAPQGGTLDLASLLGELTRSSSLIPVRRLSIVTGPEGRAGERVEGDLMAGSSSGLDPGPGSGGGSGSTEVHPLSVAKRRLSHVSSPSISLSPKKRRSRSPGPEIRDHPSSSSELEITPKGGKRSGKKRRASTGEVSPLPSLPPSPDPNPLSMSTNEASYFLVNLDCTVSPLDTSTMTRFSSPSLTSGRKKSEPHVVPKLEPSYSSNFEPPSRKTPKSTPEASSPSASPLPRLRKQNKLPDLFLASSPPNLDSDRFKLGKEGEGEERDKEEGEVIKRQLKERRVLSKTVGSPRSRHCPGDSLRDSLKPGFKCTYFFFASHVLTRSFSHFSS
jgi:hypothetical protein